MPSRREVAIIGSVVAAVAGAVVIWFGAAAAIGAAFGQDRQDAAPWLALAKFASLAWVAVVGWTATWRRLDEREREARKFCWFIGSTAAILLTAPIVLLGLAGGGGFLAQFVGRHGAPGVYLALGWGGLVAAQLLSSLVARAGWWAARR